MQPVVQEVERLRAALQQGGDGGGGGSSEHDAALGELLRQLQLKDDELDAERAHNEGMLSAMMAAAEEQLQDALAKHTEALAEKDAQVGLPPTPRPPSSAHAPLTSPPPSPSQLRILLGLDEPDAWGDEAEAAAELQAALRGAREGGARRRLRWGRRATRAT